jgi:hypothetical protein
MIYFVPKEEGTFNKGDKIKVFMRKFNPELDDFEEELIDNFTLENLFYDEKLNTYILVSDLKIEDDNMKERLNDADIIIVKE